MARSLAGELGICREAAGRDHYTTCRWNIVAAWMLQAEGTSREWCEQIRGFRLLILLRNPVLLLLSTLYAV